MTDFKKTGNNSLKEFIEEIELAAETESTDGYTDNVDYSVVLPAYLRCRVKKIMPYEFDEFDRNVYRPDSETEKFESARIAVEADKVKGTEQNIEHEKSKNASTLPKMENTEKEQLKFELKLEDCVKHSLKKSKKTNWFSTYLCKPRKERVIWDSKIYKPPAKLNEKTLDEQAEELMNASAERFVTWLNTLGSSHESDLTKDQVKALFSIEGDRKLLASIIIDPKEVKAIAKIVADQWKSPNIDIELKYEEFIKNRWKSGPKEVRTVAFGRTIPYKERAWVPSDGDKPMSTVFPSEIITGERLFNGIGHLRSTKAYMDFCRIHPDAPKPKYLVENGFFKETIQTTTNQDVPLYELWKLRC